MNFREPSIIVAEQHLNAAVVADSDFPHIGRWKSWAEKMRGEIPQLSTAQEVLHYAQCVMPFTHIAPTAEEVLNRSYALLRTEFPWLEHTLKMTSENVLSSPDRLAYVKDNDANDSQYVSNMFFWHMRSVFVAQTWCDSTERVLEIGGGYGAFARLWLLSNVKPCERYVIVDIPESLFFAEVCMRQEFGNDVGYFLDSDPGTRILLVPTTRLVQFKDNIDLVISIGSLQEMSPQWVMAYMKWLDDSSAQSFYSLNYAGCPLNFIAESRNFWAPCPTTNWSTVLLNDEPPLVKMYCIERHFLEALYARKPPQQKFSDWSVKKGYKLTRKTYIEGLELLRQDWSDENANAFIERVVTHWPGESDQLPKELIAIQHTISESERRTELHAMDKVYLQ